MKKRIGYVLLCLVVTFIFAGCSMIIDGNVNINASSEPTIAVKLLLSEADVTSTDDTDLADTQAALAAYNISVDEVDETIDGQEYLGVNMAGKISDIKRAVAETQDASIFTTVMQFINQMSLNNGYLILDAPEAPVSDTSGDTIQINFSEEQASDLGDLASSLVGLNIKFDVDGTLIQSSGVTVNGNQMIIDINSSYPIYAKWQVSSAFVSANAQYFGDGVTPTATPVVSAMPSPMPSATPVMNVNNFNDVSGHWAYNDIKWAVESGLMNGIDATTFAPDGTLTRGMLVTILGRYDGADVSGYTSSSFGDVDISSWYGKYVQWAELNGIVTGFEDGTFRPNENISRQDLATILWRYIDYKDWKNKMGYPMFIASFVPSDIKEIADYAGSPVSYLCDYGIINGMDDGTFQPLGNATRAQVAKIFHTLDNLISANN